MPRKYVYKLDTRYKMDKKREWKERARNGDTEPKILIWDIETSLMKVSTFSLYNDRISHDAILQDWNIICGAWKWLGEKEVHSFSVVDDADINKMSATLFPGMLRDDYNVCTTLRATLLEADYVVHHNGDKFDLKKLNTRLIYHGIDPLPSKISTIDTLKAAKQTFSFTSNRLDYLGKFLEVGGKLKTESGLWSRALNGDITAIQKMVPYCKQDVKLLERVFKKMRPYIQLPNFNVIRDKRGACPNCGSKKIIRRDAYYTKERAQVRWSCNSCTSWFLEKRIK